MTRPTLSPTNILFLGVSLAVATASCGGIDTDPFDPVGCTANHNADVLSSLSLPSAADYLELRVLYVGGDEAEVQQSVGTTCATATDAAACQAALQAASATEGFQLGQCVQVCNHAYLVVNRGDEVSVVSTLPELRELLGAIDAPSEAVMTALTAGYHVSCGDHERGGVFATADGYEVLATRITSSCEPVETTLYRLRVSGDGAVEVIEDEVIESEDACI